MSNLIVSSSPHITKRSNSTRRIMLDVIIALMPVLIAATFFFGYLVIVNAVLCIGFCLGAELLYCLIISKKWNKEGVKQSSVKDLSCIVTGLILALNLPTVIKVTGWDFNFYVGGKAISNIVFSFDTVLCCLMASVFSIVLVKMLFGGIGKNFVNPAAMGRIFLFLAVGLSAVQTIGFGGLQASTGSTWLSGNGSTRNQSMFFQMFIGNTGSAAVGETSVIALFIGFVYLSVRKVIDFRLPLMIILSTALFAFLFDGLVLRGLSSGAKLFNNVLANIMSGGLLFGAIFMATDYSTNPNTFFGTVIYAVGIGLFTMLIRVFAQFPEGVSFAIVIMNLTVPLIDKYIVPKPFGFIKPAKKAEVI